MPGRSDRRATNTTVGADIPRGPSSGYARGDDVTLAHIPTRDDLSGREGVVMAYNKEKQTYVVDFSDEGMPRTASIIRGRLRHSDVANWENLKFRKGQYVKLISMDHYKDMNSRMKAYADAPTYLST